jgi:hypothetical protein
MIAQTERVKAIYHRGTLQLLDTVALPEGVEVWVELHVRPQPAAETPPPQRGPLYPVCPQPPETLAGLIGLVAVGGDALADSEALYDADWN